MTITRTYRGFAPLMALFLLIAFAPLAARAQSIGDSCSKLGHSLMSGDDQSLLVCLVPTGSAGQTTCGTEDSPTCIYKAMTSMAATYQTITANCTGTNHCVAYCSTGQAIGGDCASTDAIALVNAGVTNGATNQYRCDYMSAPAAINASVICVNSP